MEATGGSAPDGAEETAKASDPSTSQHLTGAAAVLVLIGIFLAILMGAMDGLVVATVLMSMGMMMMPPMTISLPLKILLFVLVDGWHLVVSSIVQSFAT